MRLTRNDGRRTNLLMPAVLLLICAGCSTQGTRTATSANDSASQDRYTMAGYEFSYKKDEDTRQKIVARFGQPISDETVGAQMHYHILSYPISGENEKLLLLFHDEELLGVFREGARASLDRTMHSHQRARSGRIGLFQSWFEGQTVYFTASQELLATVPKWNAGNGAVPPLLEAQAEAIALEWRQRHAPDLSGTPKVNDRFEIKSIPGVFFYVVDLGIFRPPPLFRQVLVLMDGSVIAGDAEVGHDQ